MSSWSSKNPKKAGLLGLLALVYGIKKVKQFLATPKDLKGSVVVSQSFVSVEVNY